jgi:hypothetical protein
MAHYTRSVKLLLPADDEIADALTHLSLGTPSDPFLEEA